MAKRAAPILFWLAALVVLVLIGAWAMLPWLVSSDVVRTAIERELTEITGQQVTVEGRVDLDLFPSPVARLYNLHVPGISDPPEPNAPDFLVVDEVEVTIPVSSLISRQPNFSRFRLVRPYMRVATRSDGKIDWTSIGGRLGDAVASMQQTGDGTTDEAETPPAPVAGKYARFGTVTIENGIVEFAEPGVVKPEKVTAISGMVSWPRLTDRLTSNITGIWRGAQFEQRTEIDNALYFFANRLSQVRLNFVNAALNYSFTGKMSIGDPVFAEGALKLSTPSMRETLDWLEIGIGSGRAVGALSLEGKIHGDTRKVRFDNLSLNVQGNSGTGVVDFAIRDNGRPSMTATLDFGDLDILSFLSAFTGSPQTANGLASQVSLSPINEMDVDLRLSAANALAGPLKFTKVAAVTQIRNGSAVFEMADANAYNGRVQARFGIEPSDAGAQATLRVNFDGVDTTAIGDALGGLGLFPIGTCRGKIDVKAPGDRWSDFLTRAEGTIEISSAGGTIKGVGFDTLAGKQDENRFFRLQDASTAGSAYDTLAIKALVQDGVIIIDNGTIAWPAGTLELNGVIPYGTASIALTSIAYPKKAEGEAGAPGVQHFIGGSWTNPYATPVLVPGTSP